MNNGKICVSVCAETADEFIENIKRAEELADVIELRFDCLKEAEKEKCLFNLKNLRKGITKQLLATFRPREQGGQRVLSVDERHVFWCSVIDDFVDFADLEFDLVERAISWLLLNRIYSFHDFSAVPDNLVEIYESLSKHFGVIKIAAQTDEITDSIAIWKLLKKANLENRQIIPIAMGEAGKWTRILGLAHGAFMTYASVDSGSETAPGQISAKDLIEIYRVKELNEKTEVFGIVGGNTGYSMSPYIHNAAFKFYNLNSVFVPLQVNNLDEFMRRIVKPDTREINLNLRGFAITIPHKIEIMRHLTSIDESAKRIGAVNTILLEDDNKAIYGFNTDADGFIQPLHNIFGSLNGANVGVIGSGGASRAVCYALKQAGAKVMVFARNLTKAESLATDFDVKLENLSTTKKYNDFDILVNTTPFGTKGKLENQTPAKAEQLEGLKLVYDLVYNPPQTKLMSEADKAGVSKIGGLEMLIAQAVIQQKIWTGLDAPTMEINKAILQKLR